MRYVSFGYSDIGQVRERNEDCFLVDDEHLVYAVADGLGGLPEGQLASRLAIRTLADALLEIRAGAKADYGAIVQRINQQVYRKGLEVSDSMGIGTTLTALFIFGDCFEIYHVGDCAAFLLHNGKFEQLTAEHTMAAELRSQPNFAKGSVLPEYLSHTLTRCIGQRDHVDAQVIHGKISPGDRLLLCSDGITKVIDSDVLFKELAKARAPERYVRRIIDRANEEGGPDNATAITLFADE